MAQSFSENDLAALIKAVHFAAEKHHDQRRKDTQATPYINHPIEVMRLLWQEGGVRDVEILLAALLHDTIEDTGTQPEEIENAFGGRVLALVQEVSDDKSMPQEERKRRQEEHADSLSNGAKQIKLADKTSNVRETGFNPPFGWSMKRRREYLAWAGRVAAGLRGVNPALEETFDRILAESHAALDSHQRRGIFKI
jgi:GTP diphosphokinase / guanosine-3',5'-bis(diphosphate) 3'-diphosphatase